MTKFFTRKQHQTKKAYSLIELSVVILIISILATGALSVAIYTANKDKAKETHKRMDGIYDAMKTYFLAHGKLPCPAPITDIMATNATYGTGSTNDGNCALTDGVYQSSETGMENLVYGMVPVRTLGLPNEMAQDAFGSKFSYIVDNRFTHATTFVTAVPTNIIIVSEAFNTLEKAITQDAIFTIISHGINKNGAFANNSAAQNARSSDSYELENDVTGLDDDTNEAVFDNDIYTSFGGSNLFDDMVLYRTRNDLLTDTNRLSLIPCLAETSLDYDWPDAAYGQYAVSTTFCDSNSVVVFPTRKCGAFGVWENAIANPCLSLNSIDAKCTGGTITRMGGNMIHTFTQDGVLYCASSLTANIFAVGGGGGGGGFGSLDTAAGGGGGGGGQVVELVGEVISGSITITVGAGGAGAGNALHGGVGVNTTISSPSVIAYGGNGGAYNAVDCITTNASAPGGGSGTTTQCGSQLGGQSSNGYSGGGGGSSENAGSNSTSKGGNGAVGTLHSITGITYGSGGGGGSSGGRGFGGSVEAGNGASGEGLVSATAAQANTGGGGGGGSRPAGDGGNRAGKNGGSGVVIIHYPIPVLD